MASNKERKLKIAIIVLSVLLAVSLSILAGLVIYLERIAPLIIPDNMITTGNSEAAVYGTVSDAGAYIVSRETEELMAAFPAEPYTSVPKHANENGSQWASTDPEVLELYAGQDYDQTAFAVSNMFPGDALYKEYNVQVSHRGIVVVHFDVNVRPTEDPEGERLEEVLGCKIEVDGVEVYNGRMKDVPDFIDHETPDAAGATTTDLLYKITAYLDGPSVGNEYMNKDLVADFRWFVEVDEPKEPTQGGGGDDDDGPGGPGETTSPSVEETTPPHESIGDGELVKPPKTGDNTVWVAAAAAAAVLFLIILLTGRRRKEEEHEA